MALYLCGHPEHDDHLINVTTLVLAEKDQAPEYIYIAALATVVANIANARTGDASLSVADIVKSLTGRESVGEEERVVILPKESENTPYGLYDLSTLATLNPTLEELGRVQQETHPGGVQEGEVIFNLVPEDPNGVTLWPNAGDPFEGACSIVLPEQHDTMPFGIYRINPLAKALAETDLSESALRAAIKNAAQDLRARREPAPWRVVIDCPKRAGNPATSHKTTFEGPEGLQLLEMIGRPASGRDIALEKAVEDDLSPSKSIERLNQQLKYVLAGQALITSLLTGVGWVTGNLTSAIRLSAWPFVVASWT